MIQKLARWILRREMADIRAENAYLFMRATETDKRWVDLNALMAHRAQQERGAIIVRRRGKRLNILAVKTSLGIWEVMVE